MNIDLIPIGDDPPNSINVIIEVPGRRRAREVRVRQDVWRACSSTASSTRRCAIRRITASCPHTLSPDGDPLDALVIARSPFIPGSVVKARPIAVLFLEDEHGGDEKLLTVPHDSVFPYYSQVEAHGDLPEIVRQQVEHFFTHYKDLEAGEVGPRRPLGRCVGSGEGASGSDRSRKSEERRLALRAVVAAVAELAEHLLDRRSPCFGAGCFE